MLFAVTHLSHLEPVLASTYLGRPVRWMTRIEFYQSRWGQVMLDRCGCFPVDRFGYTLPAVRRAIRLIDAGETVGVFPEGGVTIGEQSVVRGGPIKQGVCTVSIRTGVPIVPMVILGTHTLNCVGPWIPPRRGAVWIGFGRHIEPPATRRSNRRTRAELSDRLRNEFMDVYDHLLATGDVTDDDVP